MEYFCRQPKLYSEFMCIGSECLYDCCHGWGYILWSNEEYLKLCSADCSESIKSKIADSFVRRDKDFRQINERETNGVKSCPFLNENKLCDIQAELGAEYLSSVCQVYPRIYYKKDSLILRTCHSSCYRIMEMLINNENIMELTDRIERIDNIDSIMGGYYDDNKTVKKNPTTQYRTDIYMFLYGILSNKNYSVEAGIVLGALAAQQISKFEANKQYDKIPKVIEALTAQLNNPEQIRKIESIAPNYSLKFNFVNRVLGYIYDCDIATDSLYENNRPSKEKYDIGIENLTKAFEKRPFAFRNIALNILTENYINFYSREKSVYENYCYFVSCFACLKFVAVSEYFFGTDRDKNFILRSTYICRSLCHNYANVEKVLGFLKEHNCTSPAHLALLIK